MKPTIVAEISANHLGSLDRARRLVLAAAECGADAVKFQTYTPDEMTLPGHKVDGGPWHGRDLYELYEEAHTPREWHEELFELAKKCGLTPFSTPFSKEGVDFLETLDCPMYKIASFELTDSALLEYTASKGKPVILSTGMAHSGEIELALFALRKAPSVTLLHCVSGYPTHLADANINRMRSLRRFSEYVGLSDHSLESTIPVMAATLGASVIEKHLTFRRSDGGPDAGFSLEPHEFASMVARVAAVQLALGSRIIAPDTDAPQMKNVKFRRSLFAARDIPAGDYITNDDIIALRPCLGVGANRRIRVIGEKSPGFKKGDPITL